MGAEGVCEGGEGTTKESYEQTQPKLSKAGLQK